jgi:hypothetical protein
MTTADHIPDPFPVGYLLHGRYRIEAELAPQRLGRAYRAYDEAIGVVVAVNVVSAEAKASPEGEHFPLVFRRAFYKHRGQVYDFGSWRGVDYAVVKYLENEDRPAVDVADP